jgi:hypothetical protein
MNRCFTPFISVCIIINYTNNISLEQTIKFNKKFEIIKKWRPEPTIKNGAYLKSLMSRKKIK